jgi:biotin synthase
MKSITSKEILNAYKTLEGKELNYGEALSLIRTEPPYLMDLYSLADKVRLKFSNSHIDTCEIANAKSGACSEDCSFCAQSARHNTGTSVYPLKSKEELLKSAKLAKEHGAESFCIVLSGRGYEKTNDEFNSIIESVKLIRKETGLEIHCSPGILSNETAKMLKDAGAAMINHNIETAPSNFKNICTTHRIEDRMNTIKAAKAAGLKVCCGGIFGLGETPEQRIEFALALRELDVDAIPVNIHQKIDGTKLAESQITLTEILNAVAVLRLVNPTKGIKIAAGRNTILADYQGLVFHAGANGMLIGNYLTISGRDISKDKKLIESLR